MAETGTYTLLVELDRDAAIEFGALGERALSAGWYAYTGSAFGPGGLSRVERHRDVAQGDNDARHWHVDYLLGHEATRIAEVVKSIGEDVECAVSRAIDTGEIEGVGCSDCDCESHLTYASARAELEQAVRSAHETAQKSAQE
ncbi:GIY-YIG nuclease family protein [Halorussus halophilus]|uniref:GIY-YIG nuclease family protein n=1 Tax=Halorussus halophilus TaxID=2650975 RepID=UPI0013014601|nr:GIY-YIG nuclease family protein [Halorussus halophilus]